MVFIMGEIVYFCYLTGTFVQIYIIYTMCCIYIYICCISLNFTQLGYTDNLRDASTGMASHLIHWLRNLTSVYRLLLIDKKIAFSFFSTFSIGQWQIRPIHPLPNSKIKSVILSCYLEICRLYGFKKKKCSQPIYIVKSPIICTDVSKWTFLYK